MSPHKCIVMMGLARYEVVPAGNEYSGRSKVSNFPGREAVVPLNLSVLGISRYFEVLSFSENNLRRCPTGL